MLSYRHERNSVRKSLFPQDKSMKFAGLIIICASSCLALILPAIGVVHFPKAVRSAKPLPVSLLLSPQSPQQPQALFAPPASSGTSWAPATPSVMQTELLPNPASPFPPTMRSQDSAQPTSTEEAGLVEKYPASKIGIGVWLLLCPVCLIGLAIWSLSPNP